MGKTRYKKATEFIRTLKETYHTDTLKFDVFLKEVRKRLGDDEDGTVKPYIKLMGDQGLIIQTKGSDEIQLSGEDGSG